MKIGSLEYDLAVQKELAERAAAKEADMSTNQTITTIAIIPNEHLPAQPKKRGRPKGSRNKPKASS